MSGTTTEGMLKIAISGPESSGKTTLAKALSTHFSVPWVPEYARDFLERSDRPYTEADLLLIAEGQLEQEYAVLGERTKLVLCDTDMITIQVWSHERFGQVAPALENLVRATTYDHVLLCRPDIPWEPDPLREDPLDRERLFKIYQATLDALGRQYTIVEGAADVRLRHAASVLAGLLA